MRGLDIITDLGLDSIAARAQQIPVRNCWHFYSYGDSVDLIFHDEADFRAGMNRINSVLHGYDVKILAFVLMDTHFHFVLYGEFGSCNQFVHEYVRRTSMYLTGRYSDRNTLKRLQLSHQVIEDDRYLKTAVCYVVKNPYNAGLPYNPWDYPWSSGALYFRHSGLWTSPRWMSGADTCLVTRDDKRSYIKSHNISKDGVQLIAGLVNPELYVSVDIVEKVFRTHRAYNYFLNITKDVDVESVGCFVSHLTIPLIELRNLRKQLSEELFGNANLRELDMGQRVRLAKLLKARYKSSPKQIAKACGLVYDEVRDML